MGVRRSASVPLGQPKAVDRNPTDANVLVGNSTGKKCCCEPRCSRFCWGDPSDVRDLITTSPLAVDNLNSTTKRASKSLQRCTLSWDDTILVLAVEGPRFEICGGEIAYAQPHGREDQVFLVITDWSSCGGSVRGSRRGQLLANDWEKGIVCTLPPPHIERGSTILRMVTG